MLIAVDPKVIPLGSRVLIIFEDEHHKRFSGIYTAHDTGGAIKGNRIDLFMGDLNNIYQVSQQTKNFGKINAKVIVLETS